MTIQDRQFGSFELDSSLQKWRRLVKDHDAISLLQQILDGPLNVYLNDPSEKIQEFNEINSIAANTRTQLNSYTVPIGKKFKLKQIDCGGDNSAVYELEINSNLKGRKRTYYSSPFDVIFKFGDDNGIEYNAGTIINVFVEHNRIDSCNFDSTIIGSLSNV